MSTRIRTIKPEWIEDEQLAEAGTLARLLSVALIVLSDDHGRGRANEVVLAAKVFTYEPDPIACLREALASLSRIGFVTLYEVRGQRYFSIRNWAKHQRIDRPSKPKFPGPDEADNTVPPAPIDPQPPNGSKPLATPSRVPQVTLAPDRDLDQGSGSGAGSRARAHAPARDVSEDDRPRLDEQALHSGWQDRWRKLKRGEPSGGLRSMAHTCFATEWGELLVKVNAHAKACELEPHAVAEAVLDALFAAQEPFVRKEFNPKLLVSQFAKWTEDAKSSGKLKPIASSRLAELDAAYERARDSGDPAAADRAKAERDAYVRSVQSRRAS